MTAEECLIYTIHHILRTDQLEEILERIEAEDPRYSFFASQRSHVQQALRDHKRREEDALNLTFLEAAEEYDRQVANRELLTLIPVVVA